MNHDDLRLGACGLDCRSCYQYLLPTDAAVQEKLLPWYREMGWLGEDEGLEAALSKRMYCQGCGHREVWWSADCRMALCCKWEKGYHNCSQCRQFICEKYAGHIEKDERYREGVEYLKHLIRGK